MLVLIIIVLVAAVVLALVQAWITRPTNGTPGWVSVALLEVAVLLATIAGHVPLH